MISPDAAGDLLLRLGHQAAHAGELADLLLASARSGVGHHEDRVEARRSTPAQPLHGDLLDLVA